MRETIEEIAELDELLSSLEPRGLSAVPDLEPEPEREARPEPVGYVTRELTGPDGSIIKARVPVYAPSVGLAPDDEAPQDERDDGAPPQTEDLDSLLAAEDAD